MLSSFDLADNVVGILVNDDVNKDNIEAIHKIIAERLEFHGKINLFVEIKSGREVSIAAMLKDIVFKFENAGNFNKIAMVSDLGWWQGFMEFKNLIMKAEIGTFSNDQRLEAMNWIMA